MKNRQATLASHLASFVLSTLLIACLGSTPGFADDRVGSGIQVLYRFDNSGQRSVQDKGWGKAMNLEIETPKTASIKDGALHLTGKSMVRSKQRAIKIHRAVTWTNELSVEVWLESADVMQEGPARIVTFSRNGTQRNFTLGQDGNRFDFRLRTTRTSDNGIPSVSTPAGTVTKKLTHVVYTRDRSGAVEFFVNGSSKAKQQVPGDFSNWGPNFNLVIGNELSGDRVWKGKVHLVAIYNRALSNLEVTKNYSAGKDAKEEVGQLVNADNQSQFTKNIAPIFVRHCLECHDSVNQQGELDLSRKVTAFAKSESGKSIIPGKPESSHLWELVQSDEMPQDRDPLSKAEKDQLYQWLKSGAKWPLERIDPAVFLRDREVDGKLLRRLTINEYIASVKMATGIDVSQSARKQLPPDLRADGFKNTAYNLNIDLKHIESFANLANEITDQIDSKTFFKRFVKQTSLDEKNIRELVQKMGRWVLRGPLSESELLPYLEIANTVRTGEGDFNEAATYILDAMLQSPRFLYHIERQRGDGNYWPVGAHDLANRISFILWGTPPDKELFDLAANGRIMVPEIMDAQVDRMLNDKRAIEKSKQFITQWLNLDRLESLKPNQKHFPKWDPQLAKDMHLETLLFFEQVTWKQKRPIGHLFNANETFLNNRLANHYRVNVPTKLPENELVRIKLGPESNRGGLLTHGSTLTVGGDEASMVSRGLFVLHDILRGVVKDPPACVDTTPVPTKKGLTQRAVAITRIENANCGGCHRRFEPLAFGLEKFDGLGSFHDADEHGNRLRNDGNILFPGDSKSIAFKDSRELMDLIAKNRRTVETVAWKLTQYSIGRPLGPRDTKSVEQIVKSIENKPTYQNLLKAIIRSDFVQRVQTDAYPN